jgi:hypothetical protein
MMCVGNGNASGGVVTIDIAHCFGNKASRDSGVADARMLLLMQMLMMVLMSLLID